MRIMSISICNRRTRKTNRIKQKKRERRESEREKETRESNVFSYCVNRTDLSAIESNHVFFLFQAQQKEEDYGLKLCDGRCSNRKAKSMIMRIIETNKKN